MKPTRTTKPTTKASNPGGSTSVAAINQHLRAASLAILAEVRRLAAQSRRRVSSARTDRVIELAFAAMDVAAADRRVAGGRRG